ncbi:protein kinase [Streptomyces sp. NPDC097595]|uniref:protein kinase domain-containing protein n=1 Tax=Streptomyces sp. NPDC097595 TaxID=3366090 RepID=UPI00382ECA70
MTSAAHHIGPDSAPDRYRLLNSIGRGGEAVLYRAEIELEGAPETVVVKVLDSRTTITIEQFQRLSTKWREQAELLRFVSRPGVVGVREHFEGPPIHGAGNASTAAGRALVLVMNHVDGLDLRDWRAERTLTTHAERREVLRALEQIADVLDWLHSGRATPSGRTVVHGDLSPGNIMVDGHGQATLVDFGLSKLTADHQTAEVWFTPGYAAPEVFEGKRTPGTDRYAFGAIAYFLISGQAPPGTPEQLRAALSALPQVAAAAPERRERILAVCAAEAGQRPESLSGWMKDLRSAVGSTTVTGTSSAESVRDAPPASVPPLPLMPPPVDPPGFPPPITASHAPGVPLPTTVNPGPSTAGYTAGPFPAPVPAPVAPPKKRRRLLRIALPMVAVVVLAALGTWGLQALKDDGDRTKAGGTASPKSSAPKTPPATEEETPGAGEPGAEDGATDTGSPEQTDPGAVDEASEVSLTTMRTVADPELFTVGSAKVDTHVYDDAYMATPECDTSPYVEFDLNREWKTFEVTVGIDDGSNWESGRLTIKLDHDPNPLWAEKIELGEPQKLSLKVENALRLRISVDEDCSGAIVALGSPVLKR